MVSQMQIYALAKRAADAVSTTVSLDTAIAKIATEADLNRVEIQRVVEVANHAVNDKLRKEAKNGTFTFKLASVDGVLKELPNNGGAVKVAASCMVAAVRSYIGQDTSLPMVKSATAANDSRRVSSLRAVGYATKIAGWVERHRKSLIAKQAGLHREIDGMLDDLVQLATDHIAAGRNIVDLKKMACSHDPTAVRVWDAVFDDVLTKVAIRVSPGRADGSASPLARQAKMPRGADLTYEAVNGAHTLLVFLDTLKNKISAEDQIAQHVRLMDTHGPAVVTGCRALDTTADVQKNLEQDLSKIAARINEPDYCVGNIEKIAGIARTLGGMAAETGRATAAIGRRAFKPALMYGVPLAATAVGAHALGTGIAKNTRDHRPGAYRGVQEGGSIE